MRKGILCAALFSLFLVSDVALASLAEVKTCTFGKEIIADPVCYGAATLASTTATGTVSVAGGPFEATDSSVESILVAGNAITNNSKVMGNTVITGPLTSTHSHFDGNLTIDSDTIVLSDTTVKGSVVMKADQPDMLDKIDETIKVESQEPNQLTEANKPNEAAKKEEAERKNIQPVIEMRCGTDITGDVTFIGLSGIVKKSPDSLIGGKVINGTVEVLHTDEKC